MDLDDLDFIHQHDPNKMLAEIDNLPQQLQSAWEMAQHQPLEALKDSTDLKRVLIAGMGGSAIGADLLAAYISPACRLPVFVQRDYGLPAWAHGPETLVIASSHSGNTEETIDSFTAALKSNCRLLAICTGGELELRAGRVGIPVWKFSHVGQPRAAVGFSFGLLLAVFARLGFIPSPEKELQDAVSSMQSHQGYLQAKVPVSNNPAKRMAGQMAGRWVNIYGAGLLAPVARRWKGQINELSKAGAGFEILPEADHNALAGAYFPEQALAQTIHVFLHAPADYPRNRIRLDLTRQALMGVGLNTELCEFLGDSRMAQMWNAIHFGDYTAFFLAMVYGVDPWDTSMLEEFKKNLKQENLTIKND